MKTAARATVVPTFDVDLFAKEAVSLTVVPPSNENPTWAWLNETSVPSMRVALHEIPSTEISHRAAFILFHVDGVSSLGDIVDNSGMPREDALGILAHMIDRGFMSLEDVADAKAPRSGIRELGPSMFTRSAEIISLDALVAANS